VNRAVVGEQTPTTFFGEAIGHKTDCDKKTDNGKVKPYGLK